MNFNDNLYPQKYNSKYFTYKYENNYKIFHTNYSYDITASVERLSSLVGAIGRTRRNRLSTEILEQLILYREYC